MPLAGPIDLVQQLGEALALDFRHGLAHRPANEIALADKANIGFVDEFENMVGAPQNANKAGGAKKLAPPAFHVVSLTALGHDPRGCLDACAEQAIDQAGFAARRRVGKLKMGLLDLPPPIEAQGEILDDDRLTREDLVEHRFEDVPGLAPNVTASAAQRLGVLTTKNGHEGVVVEPYPLRPPGDEHRLLRRQQQTDQCPEARRPLPRRTERRRCPIERADAFAHFPPSLEEEQRGHARRCFRTVQDQNSNRRMD